MSGDTAALGQSNKDGQIDRQASTEHHSSGIGWDRAIAVWNMQKTTLAYIPVAPCARWPAWKACRPTKTPLGGRVRVKMRKQAQAW